MARAPSIVSVALVLLSLEWELVAQATWSEVVAARFVSGPLAWDANHGLAWSVAARDGVLETSAWDGQCWQLIATGGPSPREAHGLAFDPLRDRLVLFGGRDLAHTQVFHDTWLFDGTSWQLTTQSGPSARCLFPMTWDATRSAVVLACGTSTANSPWGTALADIWAWDGTSWSRLPGLSEGRIAPALGADPVSYDLVLCGGHAVVGYPNPMPWSFDETWTLSAGATRWTRRIPSVTPGGRSAATLVFDPMRNHLQILGGSDIGYGGPDPLSPYPTPYPAILEWTGTDWAPRGSLPSPAIGLGAAFDTLRRELVVFGGDWLIEPADATWLRDVTDQWRRPGAGAPQSFEAVTWDGARAVMLGLESVGVPGSGFRTWTSDGHRFQELAGPSSLGITRFVVLAWHAASQRAIALGSTTASLYGNETWSWDGSTWTDLQPAVRPTPRYGGSLAADPSRGVLVLFGGYGAGPFGGSVPLDDTWEWDGSRWTHIVTAHAPSPRRDAALTFDARRGRMVLYGGNGNGTLGDLWEFDGVDWTPGIAPTGAPLFEQSLCDDVVRARLVLAGRSNSSSLDRETLEWDGTTWTRMALGDPRSGSVGPLTLRMIHDPLSEQVLAWFDRGLWVWRTPQPARVTAYGVACATSLGPLALTVADRPWLGDTLHGEITPVPNLAAAAVFVGASDRRWGSVGLPFALDAAGAPGCTVLAEPILLLTPPLGATTRAWSVFLPASASLAGAELFAQGVALDPAANPFGLALSAGLALRMGLR